MNPSATALVGSVRVIFGRNVPAGAPSTEFHGCGGLARPDSEGVWGGFSFNDTHYGVTLRGSELFQGVGAQALWL